MKEKAALVLSYDLETVFQTLPSDEAAALIKAIFAYDIRGEEPNFEDFPVLSFTWKTNVKQRLDKAKKAYQEKCNLRKIAGSKGGRPPKDENQTKAKKPIGFSENQTKAKKPIAKEYDCDFDCDCDCDCEGDIDYVDIPPISPPKLKNWELQFEEFWKEYPRKVGKGAAKRAFEKVIKSMTLETLVTAVRRQKCGSQWTKDNGQFIPHPATWLNQARWEDEVDGGVVNDGNRNAATSRNWNLHTDI